VCGLVLTAAVSQTFPVGPLPLEFDGQPKGDSVGTQFRWDLDRAEHVVVRQVSESNTSL